MGRYVIKMPDVGEGITEAEIVEWNVAVGDFVKEDDVLAAVMTDKATVEIPSPVTGTVESLTGEIGELTPVGAGIISIEVDGEGNADELEETKPVAQPEVVKDKTEKTAVEPVVEVKSEPIAAAKATTPAVIAPVPVPMSGHARLPRAPGEKPLASPSVRKRAMEAGVRLDYVSGSGPAGRILHDDLDAYLAGAEVGSVSVLEERSKAKTGVEEWKVIGLRRKIAEKMQQSKRHIPHITYVEEIDVTELERLRGHLNDNRGDDQPKLTILPFLMRAMVVAAGDVPKVSSHYDDEQNVVRQFEGLHIGMAAQTDGGLMVPVVRHAEARDIYDLAGETKRLAEAARDGSITRDELTGSTITLSSLGAMGGIVSTPVINAPEVAIVGVNKVAVRPVYIEGEFVPRKIMNLSSSFDHRIVDGWDAAVFIQKIKSLLEHPATLFI